MRFMPVQYLKPNTRLQTMVMDKHFRILLRTPCQLTDGLINNLSRLNYHSVYIDDPLALDFQAPLSNDLTLSALKVIKSNFDVFYAIMYNKKNTRASQRPFEENRSKDIQLKKLIAISEEIISELNRRGPMPIFTIDVKSEVLYPMQHALNTGILAISVGLRLNLTYNELKSLFLASVAIEIGNLSISSDILNKRSLLTAEEFNIVKQHTTLCFQEIKSCSELNQLVKIICLEHHERMDGTGYPNGLDRKCIHKLTRIVSICDAYDAITSDRSHRPAYPPFKALSILEQSVDKAFDPIIYAKLKEIVVPYPPGMCLTLDEGVVCIKDYLDSTQITYVNLETQETKIIPLDSFTPHGVCYR